MRTRRTIPRFECFIAQLQARLHALPRHIHLEVLRADKAVNIAGIRLAGLNTASFKKAENYYAACKAGSPHAAEGGRGGVPNSTIADAGIAQPLRLNNEGMINRFLIWWLRKYRFSQISEVLWIRSSRLPPAGGSP